MFLSFGYHYGIPLDELLNQVFNVSAVVVPADHSVSMLVVNMIRLPGIVVLLQVHGIGRVLVYTEQTLIDNRILLLVCVLIHSLGNTCSMNAGRWPPIWLIKCIICLRSEFERLVLVTNVLMPEPDTLHKLRIKESGLGPLLVLLLVLRLLASGNLPVFIGLNSPHLLPLQVISLVPESLPPLNVFEQVVARFWQDRRVVWVWVRPGVHAPWIDLRAHHVTLVEVNQPV